jgi:hypothetical protein
MDNLERAEKYSTETAWTSVRARKSGNPIGKPKRARNQATLPAESLLEGEVEAITRKLINRALEDDTTALRLCLERRVTRIAARELYGRCRQRLAPTNPAFFPDRFSGFVVPQSCVACARYARFKQAGVPLSPGRPKSARPRR